MAESRHPPPPGGEAKSLTRDTRLAAVTELTDNDGAETWPAAGIHRRLAITRIEADG